MSAHLAVKNPTCFVIHYFCYCVQHYSYYGSRLLTSFERLHGTFKNLAINVRFYVVYQHENTLENVTWEYITN